jgi:AraC family transcriptional regulator
VTTYRCDLKPGDPPVKAVHRRFTIGHVKRGSFRYHVGDKSSELVAGSILVGCPDDEFVCTHENSFGDDCLAFAFDASVVESFESGRRPWLVGSMPPLAELVVLGELATAAADGRSDIGLDEVAMLLAARFLRSASHGHGSATLVREPERRRAIESAYWIEAHSHEPINLEQMARRAELSPFHFLRSFIRVVGVTPHQYLVRSRLRSAAALLAGASMSITEIADAVGFSDLSNFIRTFGRAAGVSPGDFRRVARGDRKILQAEPAPTAV